jgi:hypothetical protein
MARMSIIVKLRRSIDRCWLRADYDSTPTFFHHFLYVIPMLVALGAMEVADVHYPDRASIWLLGAGALGSLGMFLWVICRQAVGTGATSTRRSERHARGKTYSQKRRDHW